MAVRELCISKEYTECVEIQNTKKGSKYVSEALRMRRGKKERKKKADMLVLVLHQWRSLDG